MTQCGTVRWVAPEVLSQVPLFTLRGALHVVACLSRACCIVCCAYAASTMCVRCTHGCGRCVCCHWIRLRWDWQNRYTESADVYSFGIVLWEMAVRQQPFDGMTDWQVP